MMNYGLGNAMMQRDGAPMQMGMQGAPEGLFGNMGPQFNPSLAAAMGMGQQQPQQKKKAGFLEQMLGGGLLGLLPALLAKQL